MTASQPMAVSSIPDAARAGRRPHVFRNLLRKELRESRSEIIAGLWIFWAMPVCLQIIFAVFFSHDHEVLPVFLAFPLVAFGWLYAVIVGAHTVCRDWGKAEEHFLLSQPVSPRLVVWAKLLAGAVVIFAVMVVVTLWGTGVAIISNAQYGDWASELNLQTALAAAIVLVCVLAIGYAFAFAAAVITRQMLAATLFAGLGLFIWMVAPFLSSRLQFLYPRFVMTDVDAAPNRIAGVLADVGAPFLALAATAVAACVILAMWSATQERVIRVGHKPLAWTVAVVVLALFGVAMGEVGNSLKVSDESVVADLGVPTDTWHWITRSGNRFFILVPSSRSAESPDWPLITFGVNARGRIEGLRQAAVPDTAAKSPERRWVRDFTAEPDGRVRVQAVDGRAINGNRSRVVQEGIQQFLVNWPVDGSLNVLERSDLALPAARRTDCSVLTSYALTDTYGYLVYAEAPTPEARKDSGDRPYSWPSRLYVFAWADGPKPSPRYEIPLPPGGRVNISDGRLEIRKPVRTDASAGSWTWHVVRFDPNHPESFGDPRSWRFEQPQPRNVSGKDDELAYLSRRLGAQRPAFAAGKGVVYVSDRFGLRVMRDTLDPRSRQPVLLGEYRASPLATVFRATPAPVLVGDSVLVEYIDNGLTAYDVSNPQHPRRIGFVSIGLSCGGTRVFGVGDNHLVLVQPAWSMTKALRLQLTVLDLPVHLTKR